MPSERAFLRQRLVLVEHWLANPDREVIPAGRGRVRRHRSVVLPASILVGAAVKRELLLAPIDRHDILSVKIDVGRGGARWR